MSAATETRHFGRVRLAAIAAGALLAAIGALAPGPASAASLNGYRVDVGGDSAPVVVRAPVGGKADVTFRVNGRVVPESEVVAKGPKWRLVRLSASDGLRAGRNKVSAIVVSADGSRGQGRTYFRISRGELLADAGDDVGSVVTSPPVSLGAKALVTRGVEHRWRVVDAPKGAKYELEGRDEPRPTLSAETPGTYRLRLTSSKRGKPTDSSDTVTVSVSPDDPPLGAPITTIADGGAIKIGNDSYGANGEVAWVVLERSTRAVAESGTVTRSDAGMKTLSDLVNKYTGGSNFQRYLMIVSGRTGIPSAQQPAFSSIAKRLGSPVLSEENFAALRAELPFTLLGVPGGAKGAATTRIPGGNLPPVPGSISGYLQKNQAVAADGTQLYDLAQPDHFAYDTHSAGTGTSNTMRINGENVSGSLPATATDGFHVVVYESLTMRRLSSQFLTTNGTGGSDRSRQGQVVDALKASLDVPGGPLVFVQTIGKPKAAGPEWAQIVKQFARIGANANLLNALDGTTTYAAVGTVRSIQPPAESSDAFDHGPYGDPGYPPGRLRGIVARARDSRLVPTVAGTPTTQRPDGGINADLIATAWQGATPFPQLAPGASDAERKAVSDYFCKAVGFCQATNSCSEIRACYWQRYSADWNQKLTVLTGLTYPGGTPGFTQAQFDSVQTQLKKEFAAVANVATYINRLQRPFEKSGSRSYVDLKLIADDVYNGLQRQPTTSSASFVLDLLSKAVKLGVVAPPPASNIAAGLSATFELAAFLSADKGGQPMLGGEVRARADRLGPEIFARIDAANQELDAIGLLFVSDYGKLTTASAKIDSDWALPATDSAALSQLTTASKQWFYTALVPTAYPYLIRANTNNARALDCMVTDRRAWPNQPDDAQMNATVGYNDSGNAITNVFFFARGMGGAMSPPDGLGRKIFAPLVGPTTGLGVEKLDFFTPRVFGGKIAHAVNGDKSNQCRVGWLPKEW